MWQRLTARAQQAVFDAEIEAHLNGDPIVLTEHLLLGILRGSENVACCVLASLEVNPEQFTLSLKRKMPKASLIKVDELTLAQSAKKAIDFAYDESRNRIGNDYIGTEHLLLGMLREERGLAGRVLREHGLELEKTRDSVILVQAKMRATP